MLIFLIFLEYRKNYKDDNEKFMLLVDASLSTPTEASLNFPFVILFIDQIIGVSSVQ